MAKQRYALPILCLWVLIWGFCCVQAQDNGAHYIQNYSSDQYDHQPQNWAVLQDHADIIYVANLGGLLEYDGVSWRVIYVPNHVILSMDMDNDGRIYVGGKNELGYFTAPQPGGIRTRHYHSLTHMLPQQQRDFSYVQRTHYTSSGIYFRTRKRLFRWNPAGETPPPLTGTPGRMSSWEPENQFHTSFVCHDTLYIRQVDAGLMWMKDNRLKLIPNGETFADKRIYMMTNFPTGTSPNLLIGTRDHGFYIYDGITARPFATEADGYLRQKKLYHGIRLKHSPRKFALATLQGGIVIMDAKGRLIKKIHKENGLQGNQVHHIFEDKKGNLWLALQNGISRIEYASPFTTFHQGSGLSGLPLSVVRSGSKLYVGTSNGLYKYTPTTGSFHNVSGVPGSCRALMADEIGLLAVTTGGVFGIKDKSKPGKILSTRSITLRRSKNDRNRVWVGTEEGLFSLKCETGTNGNSIAWNLEKRFDNIGEEIGTIVEEPDGSLWLGTATGGVIQVSGLTTKPLITRYGSSHGLPAGEINLFYIAAHTIFATDKGIYRFDKTKEFFLPDNTLGKPFRDGSHKVFRMAEDRQGHIWFHAGGRNLHAIPQADGTFSIDQTPFLRMPLEQVNHIYPDAPGNVIWFAGNSGLIKFDRRVKKDYAVDYAAIIREVAIAANATVYDIKNNRYKPASPNLHEKPLPRVLDYRKRNLRFRFAAPFFENEAATMYRYRLAPYDKTWSRWSSETQKDYTNLDAGGHRFHVQARNIYRQFSQEAVYDFEVLPPWHRTWWAFTIYAAFFLLLFYIVLRWRSAKLEQQKQILEHTVQLRTQEVNEKNLQLQQKSSLLEEKSRQLQEMAQVKSRFFANISHEFRTPLTLIIGPLEQMLSESPEINNQKRCGSMLRNSQRLLHLIDQLLELSKFESGKMKLHASTKDLIPFLKAVLSSFELITRQSRQQLVFTSDQQSLTLNFDSEKLDKIICNLLSNAVKFTPVNGKITLSVYRQSKSVEISVHNTGSYIPAPQIPLLFDRFYQADHTYEGRQKGSGIGLALVKELVNLHHGFIRVHSDAGNTENKPAETEFIVTLPLGKALLQPPLLMDPPEISVVVSTIPPTLSPIEQAREQGNQMEDDQSGQQRKDIILVVEDSHEMRDYICEPLRNEYTVIEAGDGSQGIHKAVELIPDLIISDIMMPGADGYQLCRKLKTDRKTSHIPIILLTARASEESIVQGLETGADDYVTKPFNARILSARIKNLMDLRRQIQGKLKNKNVLQPTDISVSSIDEVFLKELQQAIEKNLGDSDFNVRQLSDKLYMSRATLYRKIMALTGETPNHFIRSYRLKRAAQLLNARFGNVTEVAMEVGFSNMAHFSKCFKEVFHQSPSTYSAN